MVIRQEQWQFPASNGEGDIFARAWLPSLQSLSSHPVAVVQISHGMSEHSARYDEFARFLCTKGFAVVANDHAGHGLSAQGHLGAYSATPGGLGCSVNDLHRLFELAEDRIGAHFRDPDDPDIPNFLPSLYTPPAAPTLHTPPSPTTNPIPPTPTTPPVPRTPRIPRILFGHSMGSIMAALYAERYHGLDALVMSGTPAGIGFSHIFQLLAGIIALTRGQLTHSPLLERLGGTVAHLTLEEKERIRVWLTRDAEKVHEFSCDALCGFDYTAGGYYAMFEGYHHVHSPHWGRRMPDIPILVVAGASDTASGSGKGPARYAARLADTGHAQVTCMLFEGCQHEILNELNRQEIYEFLGDWLKKAIRGKD